ncbi:hypothetical protein RFI_09592, partial [Reticulomyxa filosa]
AVFVISLKKKKKEKRGSFKEVDGAFFGTTFAHLFFLVFPELKPEKSKEHYVPRVFGFKLHRTWHQKSLEAARRAQLEYQEEKRRLEASRIKTSIIIATPMLFKTNKQINNDTIRDNCYFNIKLQKIIIMIQKKKFKKTERGLKGGDNN